MHKRNDKGFTLIELLAVVIILIIVLLIAITRVKKAIDKNADNALKANAGSFIKAVNGLSGSVEITKAGDLENGLLEKEDLYALGLSMSGTKPDAAYVLMANFEVSKACMKYGKYIVTYKNGNVSEPSKGNCDITDFIGETEYAYEYTGTYQEFTAPIKGNYFIQVWGAQGGYRTTAANGGKGGYSEGTINLNYGEKLYIYVGGSGNTGGPSGGFNGGGSKTTYPGGGGATDVRVEGNTLYHRIIVAGGGGSDGAAGYSGKAGGGLTGLTATETDYCSGGEGATQMTAGLRGRFGQGGSGGYNSAGSGGGGFGGAGGGGWYGGGGVDPDRSDDDRGGGGGSGFVYDGTNTVPNKYAVTSHVITNGKTLDGTSSEIPSHDGTSFMTGNEGNGYAKITYIR